MVKSEMKTELSIRCIIVEDEKPASDILELYISNIDFLQLKGVFTSASQALKFLGTEDIDLIFTDINLPGISGISFVKSLYNPPSVIFTTAHPEFAVEGFALEAIDYLLKPISFERFLKSVNRAVKLKSPTNVSIDVKETQVENPFIFVKCDKKMTKIYLEDIVYFEAQKNYLLIVSTKGEYRTYLSLTEMEEKIPEHLFLRIHRSFIVSKNKILSFNHSFVEVEKVKLPIGRYYSLAVSNALKSN